MKYTVEQGSCAALNYIRREDGRNKVAIYMCEKGISYSGDSFDLPKEVTDVVEANFNKLFTSPYASRTELIANMPNVEVDINSELAVA